MSLDLECFNPSFNNHAPCKNSRQEGQHRNIVSGLYSVPLIFLQCTCFLKIRLKHFRSKLVFEQPRLQYNLTFRRLYYLAFSQTITIIRTLREDQPLRLLLNLLFYHFNHSEPTYKSQRIKLLDVIATCNQLNVNALN